MNPVLMNGLDWWRRANFQRWIPATVQWSVILMMSLLPWLLFRQSRLWRQANQMIQETIEEIERAKQDNTIERKRWTSLSRQEFQSRIQAYVNETIKISGVSGQSFPRQTSMALRGGVSQETWRTAGLTVEMKGNPDQWVKVFSLLRTEPLIMEVTALACGLSDEGAEVKAIVEFTGMGWPLASLSNLLPPEVVDRLEGYREAFSEPKEKKVMPPEYIPKPQPPWKLTGFAGGSIYLHRLVGGEDTKIMRPGESLYGWMLEIPEDSSAKGVLLKKGKIKLEWPMSSLSTSYWFDGVQIKKSPTP